MSRARTAGAVAETAGSAGRAVVEAGVDHRSTTARSRASTTVGSGCRSRPPSRRRRRCRPWSARRSGCRRRSRGRTPRRGSWPDVVQRVEHPLASDAAGLPGDRAVGVGIARDDRDDLQIGMRGQRLAQRPRRVDRPEVLVLEIDQPPRTSERLEVRAGDAAFAVRRERVRGCRRAGYVRRTWTASGPSPGAGRAGGERAGLVGCRANRWSSGAHRIARVERRGIASSARRTSTPGRRRPVRAARAAGRATAAVSP